MDPAAMHAQDTLIRGARVIDGSGNPWFYADVVLSGGKISAIAPPGRIDVTSVAHVVDADGQVVCPGFIDIQSHSIVPLMRDGRCLSKIMQGVTTEVMGEVWTPAPVAGYFTDPMSARPQARGLDEWAERAKGWTRFGHWLQAFEDHGVSPNVASFLGGGTLRRIGRDMEMGPSSPEQLAVMQRVMDESMQDGAVGISYALIYPPEAFVDTDEIVAICDVVARYGGVYITHLRSEGDTFLEALDEAIEIGERSGVAVEVYHLKVSGRRNWPIMETAIERFNAARARGIDITADMYPYTASGTGLTSVLPPFASEGGKLMENLRDPEARARIREATLNPDGSWEAMADLTEPEGVIPIGFYRDEHQGYVGRSLADIAAERGQDWVDCAMDLISAEGQRIGTIYHAMQEENVRLQLQQPWNKVSSDAGGLDPEWAIGDGPTHPRAYGTWPRVLGHYARDEAVLGLEDAIRKMTWAVAQRCGLRERGLLREGMAADVVVFDPATIRDNATFVEPHQLATGITQVWVNGVRVVMDGDHTGATPGRFVKPS